MGRESKNPPLTGDSLGMRETDRGESAALSGAARGERTWGLDLSSDTVSGGLPSGKHGARRQGYKGDQGMTLPLRLRV